MWNACTSKRNNYSEHQRTNFVPISTPIALAPSFQPGGLLELIFVGYVPLLSQIPEPIIVYTVAIL